MFLMLGYSGPGEIDSMNFICFSCSVLYKIYG
jgi:hypothetical protein